MSIDLLVLTIKPGHVIGAGEDDTLDVVLAGAFIEIENTLDIGLEDLFEGSLHRHAAKVNDLTHELDLAKANVTKLYARWEELEAIKATAQS